MEWSLHALPDAMRNLTLALRERAGGVLEKLRAPERVTAWLKEMTSTLVGEAEAGSGVIIHLLPVDGEWVIRREGGEGEDEWFERRRPALKRARALARKRGATLRIHRRDGSLEHATCYGT